MTPPALASATVSRKPVDRRGAGVVSIGRPARSNGRAQRVAMSEAAEAAERYGFAAPASITVVSTVDLSAALCATATRYRPPAVRQPGSAVS